MICHLELGPVIVAGLSLPRGHGAVGIGGVAGLSLALPEPL